MQPLPRTLAPRISEPRLLTTKSHVWTPSGGDTNPPQQPRLTSGRKSQPPGAGPAPQGCARRQQARARPRPAPRPRTPQTRTRGGRARAPRGAGCPTCCSQEGRATRSPPPCARARARNAPTARRHPPPRTRPRSRPTPSLASGTMPTPRTRTRCADPTCREPDSRQPCFSLTPSRFRF